MTDERILAYLDTIIDSAREGATFVRGTSRADFHADRKTQLAVLMSIVVIAEACARIGKREPTFFEMHPEIAWDQIRGLRNRSIHAYDQLDLDVVWEAVTVHFGPLEAAATRLLAQIEAEPRP